jgi:hypothetical protein
LTRARQTKVGTANCAERRGKAGSPDPWLTISALIAEQMRRRVNPGLGVPRYDAITINAPKPA